MKKSLRSILEDISSKDYVELPQDAEESATYGDPDELKKQIAVLKEQMIVITSYSIHYTKLYESTRTI